MKVLVIGGTGNISRGIVAALQSQNREVVLFNGRQYKTVARYPRNSR